MQTGKNSNRILVGAASKMNTTEPCNASRSFGLIASRSRQATSDRWYSAHRKLSSEILATLPIKLFLASAANDPKNMEGPLTAVAPKSPYGPQERSARGPR